MYYVCPMCIELQCLNCIDQLLNKYLIKLMYNIHLIHNSNFTVYFKTTENYYIR